jgi:hypothetical protein
MQVKHMVNDIHNSIAGMCYGKSSGFTNDKKHVYVCLYRPLGPRNPHGELAVPLRSDR